jgi:hypothetical protein
MKMKIHEVSLKKGPAHMLMGVGNEESSVPVKYDACALPFLTGGFS